MLRSKLLFAFLAISLVPAHAAYLYAPSDTDAPGLRSALQTLLGEQVDYLDASSSTPTLAQLQAYKGVFTWANYSYANSIGFGDALADYVDAGGRVVLGAYFPYFIGNFLEGRIRTAGYAPVTSTTSLSSGPLSYSGDGTGPLWAGVSNYESYNVDDTVLQGNGVLNGTFTTGAIAGAYRPDGRVVYVAGMAGDDYVTGDSARLLANALTLNATNPVPEPASVFTAMFGVLTLVAARRKYRR